MVGERIIQDIPSNVSRFINDIKPGSVKPTPQSGIDAANRFSSANRRVYQRYVGGITGKVGSYFGR